MTADARPGPPRVVAFGDAAVLVEVEDLPAAVRLDAAVRSARAGRSHGPLARVVDQVPGARSVLVRTDPGADLTSLAAALRDLAATAARDPAAGPGVSGRERVVELPVVYDGADLAEVADLTGLTVAEVVARHTAPLYTAAFGGFMPGFAYLVGLDPVLRVPRRAAPRERVPAGSVAVADEFTAVYPAATPGGWRLLGRCPTPLFDLDRDPPALVTPGTRVRFVATDDA